MSTGHSLVDQEADPEIMEDSHHAEQDNSPTPQESAHSPAGSCALLLSHANQDAVASLNGMAAALMKAKRFVAAIDTLRDALAVLSHCSDDKDSEDEDPSDFVRFRASALVGGTERISRRQDTAQDVGSTTPADDSFERRSAPCELICELIYAHPLLLCESSDCLSAHQDPPLSVEEMTAVVLFNLALAHHLAGESRSSSGYIDRALSFYKLAETMLLRAADATDESPIHTDVLVKGIMNNVGQICLGWGRFRTGRAYFERLQLLIRELHGDAASFDTFSLNAFITTGMISASAA